MRLFAALFTLLVISSASQAQTQRKETPIYRCGPEGRELRDAPCPAGGAADTVQFDQPSSADARAARERQQSDAREARRLEKERKAQEARDLKANARATVIGPQSAASAASSASPTKKAPKAPKGPKIKTAKATAHDKLDPAQAPAPGPALGPKPQR